MKKRRLSRGLAAAPIIILLYSILVPHPLGREEVLRAAWSVDLASSGARRTGGAALAPFQAGDRFGYVSADGLLALKGTTDFRVSLSERGFVTYGRVGTTWLLQDPTGQVVFPFSGDGYPLLSPDGERLFLVRTDLTGLTELDARGEAVWTHDFPTLVTTASIAGDWVVAGLVDGTVAVLDRHGVVVMERLVDGSRLGVVLGSAITPDGSRLAVVSGIDPQLVTVFERRGPSWQLIARAPLETDYRREVRISFAPGGRWLAAEGRDGVAIVDSERSRMAVVPLHGTLSGLAFLPAAVEGAPSPVATDARPAGRPDALPSPPVSLVAVSQEGTTAELVVVRPLAGVVHRESIPLSPRATAASSRPTDPLGGQAYRFGVGLSVLADRLVLAAYDRLTGLSLEAR